MELRDEDRARTGSGAGRCPNAARRRSAGAAGGTEKGLLFAERDTEVGPENLPPPPLRTPRPDPAVEVFQDHPRVALSPPF